MRSFLALAFLLLTAPLAHGEAPPRNADSQGDTRDAQDDTQGDVAVAVQLDAGEQSGRAQADILIHATPEAVWSLITSCVAALDIVPGLVGCEVLETAHDQSWQRVRHVLDYSWFVPKLSYEIRATYDKPRRATISRVSGDLKTLNAAWTLKVDGDSTLAHYSIELVPGFWVPRWLVRNALKRDLPKMMRALRARAESLPR